MVKGIRAPVDRLAAYRLAILRRLLSTVYRLPFSPSTACLSFLIPQMGSDWVRSRVTILQYQQLGGFGPVETLECGSEAAAFCALGRMPW